MKLARLSNMELLRIVAMFLVLIFHANFFVLGSPKYADIVDSPLSSFSRLFFESLALVCVNVFVLISGWFAISLKLKSILGFIFQCLFFSIGIYTVCLLCGLSDFSVKGIAECFFLDSSYWFIKSYLGLYILSPLLNAFISAASEKQVRMFLIAFYVFQTAYGWNDATGFFEGGYSTISFVGLYILARYARLYSGRYFTLPRRYDLLIYLSIITFIAVTSFVLIYKGIPQWSLLYSYINPLVILASISLLMFFSKLNIQSNSINTVATSTFSVYLLHMNPNLCFDYFVPSVEKLYALGGGNVLSINHLLRHFGICSFCSDR